MADSWRCNCGEMFKKQDLMIKHYRAKHPNDTSLLFEQLGTVGDKFADSCIKEIRDKNFRLAEELKEVKHVNNNLITDYNALVERYNKLEFKHKQISNVLTVFTNVIEMTKQSIGLADKVG